jgi:hypothetical protein
MAANEIIMVNELKVGWYKRNNILQDKIDQQIFPQILLLCGMQCHESEYHL